MRRLKNGTLRDTMATSVKCRLKTVDEDNKPVTLRVDTTPGRMLLSEVLPRHPKVPFTLINRLLTKKDIQKEIQCAKAMEKLFSRKAVPGAPPAPADSWD